MLNLSSYLYLCLLILICLFLVGWGVVKLDRIYQYPFMMGGIFSVFVLPQTFALINNPQPVTQEGLSRLLLMSCLCISMCWFGYQFPANSKILKKLDVSIYPNKLLHGAIFLIVIANLAHLLILQLPIQVQEQTQWTGIITIYAFFRDLIFPGFAILLILTIQQNTISKFILTAISTILPLQLIILQGRREPTAIFILTIAICLYYFYRYLPPRWLVITILIFTLLAIPLIGSYRQISKSGNWNKLTQLNPVENIQNYIEQGKFLELKNAAVLMDATVKNSNYGYGTNYWNRLVDNYIPGQLVGREFKKSLKIGVDSRSIRSINNYRFYTGSTITGIADSFVEFDYFGCLFFFMAAYMFKNLWVSAIYNRSFLSQIVYITLINTSLLWVTHGTTRFFADVLFCMIFIGGIFIYAYRKSSINVKQTSLIQNHDSNLYHFYTSRREK